MPIPTACILPKLIPKLTVCGVAAIIVLIAKKSVPNNEISFHTFSGDKSVTQLSFIFRAKIFTYLKYLAHLNLILGPFCLPAI